MSELEKDNVPLRITTKMVLNKFEGEVPADCPDPIAAGYKLLESIEIIYHPDGTEERRVVVNASD